MSLIENQQKEITVDFHGAAIIDETGQEVPITETMIQEVFKEIEERPSKPKH